MFDMSKYAEYVMTAQQNIIDASWALSPELAGIRIFDAPIYAVGAADDPMFAGLRAPEAVGPQLRLPDEWLPGAVSVICYFLPFSDAIKASNGPENPEPSQAWLHGRIEGQRFLEGFSRLIRDDLRALGFGAVAPILEPEFYYEGFTSNWSERHAAYICGLGTFCLSKGMITERGVCGRFGSIITTAKLPVTPRPYTGLYDYCIRCGKCAKNCPAGAIDLETGKDHKKCAALLHEGALRYAPRYGCGKCQVDVPCMNGIPGRVKK